MVGWYASKWILSGAAVIILLSITLVELGAARRGRLDNIYRDGFMYEPKVKPCGSGPPFFRPGADRKHATNGTTRNHSRISGGMSALNGEFPSFVSIRFHVANPNKFYTCSGVLIDDDVVLTAAHCFNIPTEIEQIVVSPSSIGVHYWSQYQPLQHEAELACVAEHYDRVLKKYDYGFIKLREPVAITDKVNTACLPTVDPDEETEARAVGQGYTYVGDDETTYAESAQVLPVKKVSCPPNMDQTTNICFKDYLPSHRGDTCSGDSGGPVYMLNGGRHTVLALISGSPRQCRPGASAAIRTSDLTNYKNLYYVLDSLRKCLDQGTGAVFPVRKSKKLNTRPRSEDGDDEC